MMYRHDDISRHDTQPQITDMLLNLSRASAGPLPPLSEIAQLLAPERQVDVRLMNGVTWSATLIERDGQGVLVRMAESRRRVFVPWTNVAAIRDALPDDDRDN